MIVLGIDSGAVHVGYCLVDIIARQRPTWLTAGECEPEEMREIIVQARPEMLSVETPEGELYPGRPSTRNLLEAGIVAGEAMGIGRTLGIRVERFAAPAWRRSVIGDPSPSDAEIRAWIYRVVLRVPTQTNSHERDACGAAIAAGQLGARRTSRPQPKKRFFRPRRAGR